MKPEKASSRSRSAGSPVLLVVDADDEARASTKEALTRRFSPDFQTISADSASSGVELLSDFQADGVEVALIAADLHLPGMGGADFLERAHGQHPGASRVLLISMDEHHTRVSLTELQALQRVIGLGRADFSVTKGWVSPEEWLYPQVQEALTAWTKVHRPGHVVYRIVGSQWNSRSHVVRDLLSRSGVPFTFFTSESAAGRQLVIDHEIDPTRMPAVIRHDGTVLHNPTLAELASQHGMATQPPSTKVDLTILGAGPAGLAAAVYGASEGLRTLVLEPQAIGGQAGTSSMIRNYLGFPQGISGGELAHRAWEQAVLLGAEFVFTQPASRLVAEGDQRLVILGDQDGSSVSTRSIILAVGVTYRRLGIPGVDRHIGAGVFYGAATSEAPAVTGEQVFVVGGANSAGQAALHLARYAAKVSLLIRGQSLTSSMSDYLIRELKATPNIEVRVQTRVVDGAGEGRLHSLILEDIATGHQEETATAAVFVLIGAQPRTTWLRGAVALDEHGFVRTGRDIPRQSWPLARSPLPLESSMPGVFAVGDVRFGSIKRVAGAVGEGSMAVGSVHEYLADLAAKATPS